LPVATAKGESNKFVPSPAESMISVIVCAAQRVGTVLSKRRVSHPIPIDVSN
jgi:hypothetical protein